MNTLQWHHISSPVMQLVKLHLIYPYWAIWSVLMRYLYNIKSIILLNTPATPPPETCSMYYLAIFEKFGVWPNPNDVGLSWLRLKTVTETASHIHAGCIQSVLGLAPLYAVNGHMGSPLQCNSCEGCGGKIFKNWGMGEPEWCWGVMVEAARGSRLHPTSILDVYNVF